MPSSEVSEISDYFVWFYFVLGYKIPDSNSMLLFEILSYFIILLVLVIERHLHYIIWHKVNSDLEINNSSFIGEKNNKVRVMIFIRILLEALVPPLLLWLAFAKLTVIGCFYVIMVFFAVICFNAFSRIRTLNIFLIVFFLIQYILIISNLSKETVNEHLPSIGK